MALNGQAYLAQRAPACACVSCGREQCERSTKGNRWHEADGSTGIEYVRIGSGCPTQATQSPSERRGHETEEGRHRCAARDESIVRVHELPAQALPCVQGRQERTGVHYQVCRSRDEGLVRSERRCVCGLTARAEVVEHYRDGRLWEL